VDGNVRRVLARLRGLPDPAPARLRALALELVPGDRPGDFNQALMELGATVCTPRAPDCAACPLAAWCEASRAGRQEAWPRRPRRRTPPVDVVETVVGRRTDGRVLLVRRPARGFLGGLWEFPGETVAGWVARVRAESPVVARLDDIRQTYSHRHVVYRPTLHALDGALADVASDVRAEWVRLRRLEGYALPAAQRRIALAARAALGEG
jgi:A/G-specific adenine glycosylase